MSHEYDLGSHQWFGEHFGQICGLLLYWSLLCETLPIKSKPIYPPWTLSSLYGVSASLGVYFLDLWFWKCPHNESCSEGRTQSMYCYSLKMYNISSHSWIGCSPMPYLYLYLYQYLYLYRKMYLYLYLYNLYVYYLPIYLISPMLVWYKLYCNR